MLPKIWRSVKKRRKRNKFDDSSMEEPKSVGWIFNYATPPTSPTRIMPDDEVRDEQSRSTMMKFRWTLK